MLETLVPLYGSFQFLLLSRYTRTLSPGRMRYFVSGVSLVRRAIFILFSAKMVSISDPVSNNAENRSACVVCEYDGTGKD